MKDGWLLSKGARGEQFSDEIEGSAVDIDPGSIEGHDGVMVKVLKEMNLWIEALKFFWWMKDYTKPDLVPCHFNA